MDENVYYNAAVRVVENKFNSRFSCDTLLYFTKCNNSEHHRHYTNYFRNNEGYIDSFGEFTEENQETRSIALLLMYEIAKDL